MNDKSRKHDEVLLDLERKLAFAFMDVVKYREAIYEEQRLISVEKTLDDLFIILSSYAASLRRAVLSYIKEDLRGGFPRNVFRDKLEKLLKDEP